MILRTTASVMVLFSALMMLAPPVSAQVHAGSIMLPPPPGPYVSSRPQLEMRGEPQRNNSRMPYVGNMPSMPMRYMPPSRQFPAPPPWWRGPMRR